MHVDGDHSSTSSAISDATIEVVNEKGESRTLDVMSDMTVDQLKVMSVRAFCNDPLSCVKIFHQFKLLHVMRKKTLREGRSLREEEVRRGDVILLLPKFESKPTTSRETDKSSPSEEDIRSATASIPFKNQDKNVKDNSTADFQREFRKILVTLIDFAAKLLKKDPEVEPILDSIPTISALLEQEKSKQDDVSQTALQQLVDMGFSTEKAKRALKLNNMSPLEAMDWLLAYDSSTQATYSSPGSYSMASVQHRLLQEKQQNREADREVFRNAAVYSDVPAIIHAHRVVKRKQFRVNSKAVTNLRQMGFDDDEVLDSLWIHTNNEVAACEWLLSDRRPNNDDLKHGLKKDSPIYKAITNDATIQLGLMKSRIFFAFLQLLEEPNCMGRWLNDSETSPVLSQIFRIYHSEKHAVSPEDRNDDSPTEKLCVCAQSLRTDV